MRILSLVSCTFSLEVLEREAINTLDRPSDEDKHEKDSELQWNEIIKKWLPSDRQKADKNSLNMNMNFPIGLDI